MTGKQRIREELNDLVLNVELVRSSVDKKLIKPAEGHKHNQILIDQALDSIEEVMKSVIGEDDVIKARQIGERSLMAVTRNQLRSQQLGRWESK